MSKIIVFEACDGCGKTTLINNLCNIFESRDGFRPLCVNEPYGGTPIGKFVREWLKTNDFSASELKQLRAFLLFSAARLEMLEDFLLQEIKNASSPVILCDRFVLSSCVYQMIPQEYPGKFPKLVDLMLSTISKLLKVDSTIYLDLKPSLIVERLSKRESSLHSSDAMDKKDLQWFTKLRLRYEEQIQLMQVYYPNLLGNLHYVNADSEPTAIAEKVYNYINKSFL